VLPVAVNVVLPVKGDAQQQPDLVVAGLLMSRKRMGLEMIYLKGQLFKNNKTGGHSRDSDWKVVDARKRHRMYLLLREAKEGWRVW
jgi:hypothetical protein